MRVIRHCAAALLLALMPLLSIMAQQAGHTLRINVTEKATGDAVIMATVELLPTTIVTTPNKSEGEAIQPRPR